MYSLKDKIKDQTEVISAIAEIAEEEVKPKAKTLKGKVDKKLNKKSK